MTDEQVFELAEKNGFQDDFGRWNFTNEELLDFVHELRQALAEPANSTTDFVEPKASSQTEQEPVAWMHNFIEGNVVAHKPADISRHPDRWTPLYTAPPKREWVGLTDEEYKIIHNKNYNYEEIACAIEAKLKEKNA